MIVLRFVATGYDYVPGLNLSRDPTPIIRPPLVVNFYWMMYILLIVETVLYAWIMIMKCLHPDNGAV